MSTKARNPQGERAALVAARDRAAERPPLLVRALLDGQPEAIVIFDRRGDVLYSNAAAVGDLPPAGVAPFVESSWLRARLVARGGRVASLQFDGKVLGDMIVVPRRRTGTWAEQERHAIRDALHEAGGRRAEAARRLGISRTTLWRRLRGGATMMPPATR